MVQLFGLGELLFWPGSITLGEMNFALLGTDTDSVALAQAAVEAGHSISWCGDISSAEAGWLGEDFGQQWEILLDSNLVDAVIVGRGKADANLRAEQVNQLAKSGMALLTSFPLVDSVLSYYEIDMARCESEAVLHHFNPLVEQLSLVDQAAEWLAAGHPELGTIEQIAWERPLEDRTKQQVLWHFSRDVELLSLVAGRLNRLGALGSPDEAATYAGLSIQLLGKSAVPVRWQVGPLDQSSSPRLEFVAKQGKLTVDFDEAGQATQLGVSQMGDLQKLPLDVCDPAQQCIQRFVQAVQQPDAVASTWPRALQAMELTDTIEISLRRGRMIEVHQQQLTEQLAFKGTMSALGCGVLMLIPPLLLFFGWLAELLGLPIAEYWPHALLGFLGIFLALQLIPKLLFKPTSSEDGAIGQETSSSTSRKE